MPPPAASPAPQAPAPPTFAERLAARLLRLLIAALGATLRRGDGAGAALAVLAELARSRTPTALVVWHHQLFLAGWLLHRELVRRGVPVVVLVSRSRDGTLASEVARRLGADVVRGSTSRGGGAALRQLLRSAAAGRMPILVPDGPRGPALSCKPGAVALAGLGGLAIQPIALAVDRAWRLRSWDRLVVPKPFARLTAVLGERLEVPAGLDGAGRERARRELEAELNRLTASAVAGGTAVDFTAASGSAAATLDAPRDPPEDL